MRRIGTIGATLAVVAALATSAAGEARDEARSASATTNQNLLLNFHERRPDRLVDLHAGVGELRASDLNPGTPRVVGSAYQNS
jgi:hypothetical protein